MALGVFPAVVLVDGFLTLELPLKQSEVKREKRFNYVFGGNFALGINLSQPNKSTGWHLYLSLELFYVGAWIYFFKLKQ